jgi:DNA-binding SARP family transcriptional activator
MLTVKLLGRFSAELDGREIPLHDGSKAQELFVYLLLRRQQAHTREEIASLLWEDAAQERSRAYLRKALWQLQSALRAPPGTEPSLPILEVDGAWLRLRPGVAVWLDVAVVESVDARSRGIGGERLDPRVAADLREAVALYTGDLLPNRYEAWCLEERERLRYLYLCLLEKLLDFSEARGDYEAGLAYGRSILGHDSTREHIHRQLMRIHSLRGDRASALRQYRDCVEVLRTELSVLPMRETCAMYERIRDGDGDAPRPAEPASATTGPLQDIVERLDRLQVALGEIRRTVESL